MALLTARPKTAPTTRRPVGDTVAEVRGHHRSFGSTHVLRGADLTVRRGEFVALLGRSGSGKSTLLRSLAGLDPSPKDEVAVTGRTSVAFQEPRLLPWRKRRAQRRAGAAEHRPRRQPHREGARRAGRGEPDREDRRLARLPVRRPGAAGLARARPGERARPAAARRAVQRARRPDAHRDAQPGHPALGAAPAGDPARHPRRRRGHRPRRPRARARRGPDRPRVAGPGPSYLPQPGAPPDRAAARARCSAPSASRPTRTTKRLEQHEAFLAHPSAPSARSSSRRSAIVAAVVAERAAAPSPRNAAAVRTTARSTCPR